MNFWGYFYGAMAIPVFFLALASRRWKLSIAGTALLMSWALTNFIVVTRKPDIFFLSYFGFDAIMAEVVLFMLLFEFSIWNAILLATFIAQLFVHLGYWGPSMPPIRYYEILNCFYIVQLMTLAIQSVRAMRGLDVRPPIPLPPRPPIGRMGRINLTSYSPPAPRGACPASIRAYS